MKIKINTEKMLKKLDNGEILDLALTNPKLNIKSSKEIYQVDYDEYHIEHLIDDSTTKFNRKGIIEVLENKRSIWESNI